MILPPFFSWTKGTLLHPSTNRWACRVKAGVNAVGTVAVLCTVACPRVTVSATETLSLNSPCSKDSECTSNHCVDNVCCASGCSARETCASSRAPGQCSPRILGEACTSADQCPEQTYCVDGVCCDGLCDQEHNRCFHCNLPGSAGHCTLTPDNTDPRHDCGEICLACFGGVCQAAVPGTDPKAECGKDQGCARGQDGLHVGATAADVCALAGGQPCGQDQDCASQTCLGGRCVHVDSESLLTNGLPDGVNNHLLWDFKVNDRGDQILMSWTEHMFQNDAGIPTYADSRIHLLIPREGSWHARQVTDCFGVIEEIAFTTVGTWNLVVQSRTSQAGCFDAGVPQEDVQYIQARWIGPQGEEGQTESIQVRPELIRNIHAYTAADQSIYVIAEFDAPEDPVLSDAHVFRRAPDTGSWSAVPGFPLKDVTGVGSVVFLDDQAVMFWMVRNTANLPQGQAHLVAAHFKPDGLVEIDHSPEIPKPGGECSNNHFDTVESVLNAPEASQPKGCASISLAFTCYTQANKTPTSPPGFGIYHPCQPTGERWVHAPAFVTELGIDGAAGASPIALPGARPGFIYLESAPQPGVQAVFMGANGSWEKHRINPPSSEWDVYITPRVAHINGTPLVAWLRYSASSLWPRSSFAYQMATFRQQ